jgi:GTP-binding protein Era
MNYPEPPVSPTSLTNDVYRSGFVSIVGKPNAGKSTLLNAILGQKLSIITPKAQTTRHRILGIRSDEAFQMIFLDTPGIIEPKYALHRAMMRSVKNTIQEAEAIVLLISADEKHDEADVMKMLQHVKSPIVLAINKVDLSTPEKVEEKINKVKEALPDKIQETIAISALHGMNVEGLVSLLVNYLPPGPPYYDPDQLTDRPERFFVSEIIREKIFLNLKEELPYSSNVEILVYEDRPTVTYIDAEIHVERQSQKGIIIGKKGEMLRKIGTDARTDIEEMIERPVFLNLYVRVTDNWKDKDFYVKNFGYEEGE